MIQSIEKAMLLIEFVAAQPRGPVRLIEMARGAGLPAPTAARIAGTLCALGWLEQVGRREGYRLGPKSLALAMQGAEREDVVSAAGPALDRLARATGETAVLAVLRGGRRVILASVEGQGAVQVNRDRLTQSYDPYATATGRLLLAHLPDDERARFVREHGLPAPTAWRAAGTRRELTREFATAARRGYVTHNTGELVGVAFPVRRHEGVVAAIGLFLPAFRFAGAHKKRVMASVGDAAMQISRVLSRAGLPAGAVLQKGKERIT